MSNIMSCCNPYALGLFFILLVALIWAASSILVQYLYDANFDSPFLLTYVGVSLFTLLLPAKMTTQCLQEQCHKSERTGSSTDDEDENSYELGRRTSPYQNLATPPPEAVDGEEQAFENNDSILRLDRDITELIPWTNEQHWDAAMKIAPVWFVANWCYNASLAYTSITSSTVLASTSSLFCYLLAVLSHDESFSWIKLLGVFFGVAGSSITAWGDVPTNSTDTGARSYDTPYEETLSRGDAQYYLLSLQSLYGDLLGLISAIGYGGYAIQTRMLCPRNEELYSMQLLLGYVGLINMLALSPIAFIELWRGVSLTWVVCMWLVLKGLFDNVLADYLWLRAVILTNATIATVGLGLTIPMAIASDFFLGKTATLTMDSIMGAITVSIGFLLVNLGNSIDDCAEISCYPTRREPTFDEDEEEALSTSIEEQCRQQLPSTSSSSTQLLNHVPQNSGSNQHSQDEVLQQPEQPASIPRVQVECDESPTALPTLT